MPCSGCSSLRAGLRCAALRETPVADVLAGRRKCPTGACMPIAMAAAPREAGEPGDSTPVAVQQSRGGCGGCGSALDVGHALAHGAMRVIELIGPSKRASIDARTSRLRTCEANRCGVYHNGWCGTPLRQVAGKSCGCRVALKVWHIDEHCPQGLW